MAVIEHFKQLAQEDRPGGAVWARICLLFDHLAGRTESQCDKGQIRQDLPLPLGSGLQISWVCLFTHSIRGLRSGILVPLLESTRAVATQLNTVVFRVVL